MRPEPSPIGLGGCHRRPGASLIRREHTQARFLLPLSLSTQFQTPEEKDDVTRVFGAKRAGRNLEGKRACATLDYLLWIIGNCCRFWLLVTGWTSFCYEFASAVIAALNSSASFGSDGV